MNVWSMLLHVNTYVTHLFGGNQAKYIIVYEYVYVRMGIWLIVLVPSSCTYPTHKRNYVRLYKFTLFCRTSNEQNCRSWLNICPIDLKFSQNVDKGTAKTGSATAANVRVFCFAIGRRTWL